MSDRIDPEALDLIRGLKPKRRRTGYWSEWDRKVMAMRGETPEDWDRFRASGHAFCDRLAKRSRDSMDGRTGG